MSYKKLLFILLFLTYLYADTAPSSADSLTSVSSHQQTSSDASEEPGYRLVTPPSVNRKKVESMVKRMRSDLPRTEIKKNIRERVFYRLVVQCFDSMTPAKRLRTDLLKSSRTPFIVLTDNQYCVVASSQMTKKAALAEQKQLAQKHVTAKIAKLSLPLPHWQARSVDLYDLRDAVSLASTISLKGTVTTIEPFEDGSTAMSQEGLKSSK